MRTKKVNRYWCDFCNKGGLSAFHMRKHELHCTLNPKRHCRVCDLFEGGSTNEPLELTKLIPSDVFSKDGRGFQSYDQEKIALALAKLREATDNCPACIMAAIRLSGHPVPVFEGFDFKMEMKYLLEDWNKSNREDFH